MNALSLGKIRCLQQLTNELGVFTIIAFDHRNDFAEALSKTLGVEQVNWERVAAEKLRIAHALAPHASAVLLDPVYSAGPVVTSGVLPDGTGFAVALEEAGYGGDSSNRTTTLMPDWSVAAIKRLGGAAVKLVVYYHPDSPTAKEQEAMVSRVAAECETHEIPLILEPICYPIDPDQAKKDPAFAALRPQLVLESARRLVPLGADILKAEFPTDAQYETNTTQMQDYCHQLSEIAAGIPWVLLSAGVNFPTFQLQIEIACDAGASGFVAGRSIWKEALEVADEAARDRFLNTIAVSRARVLADTANYRAVPWILTMVDLMPEREANLSSAGKLLYNIHCVKCHGPDRKGDGRNYPDITHINAKYTREDLIKYISVGRGMMTAFDFLTEDEKNEIATYVLFPELKTPAATASNTTDSLVRAVPYTTTGYNRWVDKFGNPVIKPPWGTLNAVNLNTGDRVWSVPLGEIDSLTALGIPVTGTENYGGPAVTAGGVIFIAATKDERFHAFDKTTGKLLWQSKLPFGGYATPAVYEAGGKEYVVVACGGGKMGTPSGDVYRAYALP